ncbi:molybdate ABC transporter substrate-binding protein [Clostridium sp.]|uniref:molybdate ABC transporter substrate-binding protein n=1 Tax=Clostridium sp. TaxID=1506 RepID=UPI002FC69E82
MIKRMISVVMVISTLFSVGCSKQASATKELSAKEFTISAAASLKEPLEEIIQQYKGQADVRINVNFGGSGTLQKQIEEGAPVDLFISAGKNQVSTLIDKGLGDKSTYKELLTNSLVLIVSNNYDKNIKSLEDLENKDVKLALGEINTVPVGQYSKEALENTKLWEKFKSKIVYARDVKSVLNYVENGEAEAGIVYYSDAVNLKNSYIAIKIPEDIHESIVYPMVLIAESENKASVIKFMEFMSTSQAKEIFLKYNFSVKEN